MTWTTSNETNVPARQETAGLNSAPLSSAWIVNLKNEERMGRPTIAETEGSSCVELHTAMGQTRM
jgi:hypothetical protein